jgi:hypothetical protein
MPLEPLPFNCRGATSDNGKARSFRDGGPDLDAVTKQFKGSPNYEEPEAETFAPSFVDTSSVCRILVVSAQFLE